MQSTLHNLTEPRLPFPWLDGPSPRGPLLMGIANVTPDSFHPSSRRPGTVQARAHVQRLIEAGADIVDIGGESTRPGATPVAPTEELDRVMPVVEQARAAGAVVSIDTRHAIVMEAAIRAGARIVNDVSALTHDPPALDLARRTAVAVVLVHMRGDPTTMQHEPRYDDVLLDVADYLRARREACESAGIERSSISLDPGIGFGKTVDHNVGLLSRLAALHGLGCPVVVGASRKSFIGRLSRGASADARLPGSLAVACAAAAAGVQILRVHDVADTRQALLLWDHLHFGVEPRAVAGERGSLI